MKSDDKISEIQKMRSALEAVQHYLLTLPEGAHKEILYQIDDALTSHHLHVPVTEKMHAALYDAKCYLLKYAAYYIPNLDDADDAGAEKVSGILRQIDEARDKNPLEE